MNLSNSMVGLFAGLLVAVAAAAGGFTGFLLAVVLGAVGLVIGSQLDGKIDFGEIVRGGRAER